MNSLISIIIPVYNVEKYIDKCLESVVNQTYKNLEILLINDGSTDNSEKNCEKWKSLDKRIRYIYQENSGLSKTRNKGIDLSLGEYIVFIDSDDYIDLDMIELLYTSILKNNSNISCCGIYQELENGDFKKKFNLPREENYTSLEALQNQLLFIGISDSACDKMYEKKLWDNIGFPVDKIYEDLGTIYKVLYKSNKVTHIGESKYHYVRHENSITTKKFNSKHMDLILHTREQCEFVKKNCIDLYPIAMTKYYINVSTVLQLIITNDGIKSNRNLYNQLRKELIKNFKFISKSKYIKFIKKVKIFLTMRRLTIILNLIKKILR